MTIQELALKIYKYCVANYNNGYDVWVECEGVEGIEQELADSGHTTFAQWHRVAKVLVDIRADRQADADHYREEAF